MVELLFSVEDSEEHKTIRRNRGKINGNIFFLGLLWISSALGKNWWKKAFERI
jgi:hypothetical protein